jgi:murein L,D-transpeptidase YcbB/YkuD
MKQARLWLAASAMAIAAPLRAQDVAPAAVAPADPAPLAAPAAVPSAPAVSSNVDAFYAARPGVLVWLRDSDTRAAAAKLPEILRRATLDGLADGPTLAASVEAAIERSQSVGQSADDMIISTAWVRYVQKLKSPVSGVSYGDPTLAFRTPSADAVLAQARLAPSLAVHIDAVARVNPFYAALRDSALKSGASDDPRVRATLDRLRLVPATGRVILVDVANAELMMLEDGQVVDSMKVIVGKPDFATPLLAGTIHYVTFNPYWHIPQDVARRKVAPVVLKRGVSYLKAARYQTVAAFGGDKEEPIDPASVDWKAVAKGDVEVHVRQLSGPANMMGKMKFGFVNDYGIFLHDTPHKDFFAKAKRNLSLGCIRVEHPEELAKWLLGRDPVPPDADSEENVQMDKGVPIYVSYLTARPDGDALAFAADVYRLDPAAAPATRVAAAATPASTQ